VTANLPTYHVRAGHRGANKRLDLHKAFWLVYKGETLRVDRGGWAWQINQPDGPDHCLGAARKMVAA